MAEETKVHKSTPPVGRTHKEIAQDLENKGMGLRSEWNTNSDHPKGREALELAKLLDEAADALTEKPKAHDKE